MNRIAPALLTTMLAASCVNRAEQRNHPCPCSGEYVCCEKSGTCIGRGETCSPDLAEEHWIMRKSDPLDPSPQAPADIDIWFTRSPDGSVSGTYILNSTDEPQEPPTDPGKYPFNSDRYEVHMREGRIDYDPIRYRDVLTFTFDGTEP